MIRLALLAIALLLPAAAIAAEPAWQRADLADLGLTPAVRRFHTLPTLDLAFGGRTDLVLTAARLHLVVDPAAAGVRAIEITVNQEPVATLRPVVPGEHTFEIDGKLLGDRNAIGLRLQPEQEGACGEVAPGTWSLLQGGFVETAGTQLPLPNDLSVLPLPFWDRAFDRDAPVALSLPARPGPELLRAAALYAGASGVERGTAVDFAVTLGALPDGHAIVFVDGAAAASALRVPVPEGPSIRMADHPDGGPYKLLVIGGRTPAELELAVRRLAAGVGRLEGEVAFLGEAPPPPARKPYDAPRWMPVDEPLRVGRIVPEEGLVLRGTRGGTIPLRFRLPPDLLVWPREWVELDLGAVSKVPEGLPPPRLDVEFNGTYVDTLPAFDRATGAPVAARLRIHRDALRGYDELLVHVTWPDAARLCGAGAAAADEAEVRLLPDSALHVEDLPHFAQLPDVASFVHDGFPFTRRADLAETAVVLPDEPGPAEIATLLSLAAHFGTITGEPGSRLQVLRAAEVRPAHEADLVLIGTPEDHRLLRRWAARFPLAFRASGPQVQIPEQTDPILALLAGRPGHRELARAAPIVARASHPAAVMAMESPLSPGRTVVAIAAGRAEDLPGVRALQGFARSRTRGGDLLLLDGGERWAFRIGPTWDLGGIGPWTRLRWFLARHWLALVPLLLGGAFAWAWPLRRSLQLRADARLAGAREPTG